jgi:hypothetical protein
MEVVNMEIYYVRLKVGYVILVEYEHICYSDAKSLFNFLNISFEEYEQFLLDNGAIYDDNNDYYFKTKKDCNKCMEKLKEKYLKEYLK